MAPTFAAAYCCARKGCGGYRYVHVALANNEALECAKCGQRFPKRTHLMPLPRARRTPRDDAAKGNGKGKVSKGIRGGYSLDRFDWFGKPFPLFNNRGRGSVTSEMGILMTFIVEKCISGYRARYIYAFSLKCLDCRGNNLNFFTSNCAIFTCMRV